MNKKRMLEEESGHAYSILCQEPWLADLPQQPVELFCGLSNDRVF